MSGAAGATNPLRRPASGSMSAQALLSMIAPALPATPQGSSAGDAMAFEGLLAAMMTGEAASNVPEPEVLPADPAANDDAPPAVSAVLVAAPPPPFPVVLFAGLDAAPPSTDDAAAAQIPALPATDAGSPAPDLAAQTQTPAPAPAKAPQDAGARTDTTAAATTAAAEKAVRAQGEPARNASPQGVPGQADPAPKAAVESPPAQAASARPVVAEAQPALVVSPVADRPAAAKAASTLLVPPTADAPVVDDAQPAAPPPAAAAKTGVDAGPAPQPVPSQPAPQPALRALAERTSKPLDAAPTADGAAVADPRAAAPAASGSAPPSGGLADAPSSPVDAAPVVAPDAAGAETPEEPAPEAPPAETASAAPAVHTAREAAAPTLSRAAIDATAQIAAQILKKLDGRATRFEMALTPDELGRVDIKLDIDAEGRLSARLAFDNPAAAADLRGRADDLRRELQQAGFHVADDAFEFAERDSGSSAFDRGPSDPGQDARDSQARAFARASRITAEADARLQPPQGWVSLSLTPSGVDLKV